jgi:hypothetical protein
MKSMKSFSEFSGSTVNEGKSSSCMSESMHKKMNEMYESMCNEMKACHEDETKMTAENYMSECSEKLNEMMENMANECAGYMNSSK